MIRLSLVIAVLVLLWGDTAFANTHYHVGVDGIPCPFCLYGIEKKLKKMPGVIDVKSNLEKGLFFVEVADGESLSDQLIRDAVTAAGFTLRSIEQVQEDADQ